MIENNCNAETKKNYNKNNNNIKNEKEFNEIEIEAEIKENNVNINFDFANFWKNLSWEKREETAILFYSSSFEEFSKNHIPESIK